MKKIVIAAAVLIVIAFLAKRFAPKVADIDWEQRFAAMPDNAPRKWMFRNMSEIHDNTERILALLDGSAETSDSQPGVVEPSAT
jgi:hypothetical protein